MQIFNDVFEKLDITSPYIRWNFCQMQVFQSSSFSVENLGMCESSLKVDLEYLF